jgi:phenylpyruvate tautomerase PptA (4-oxalocrotonate tautomerase family)
VSRAARSARSTQGSRLPIYQCICPEGLLDQPTREAIAEEITRIHCDATGVPPSFVNILFTEMTSGTCFVGEGALRIRSSAARSASAGISRPGSGY